jgi:hypothetical protein
MKKYLITILVLCFILPNFARADILSNLLLHYKFDEGSGTTANDSAGTNNATLNNGATYETGKIGAYALSLDGTNDYAVSNGSMALGPNFTVAVWVKPNGAQVNFGRILETNFGTSFYLGMNSNATSYQWMVNNVFITGGTVSSGTWTHVVGTLNGTTFTEYINGLQVNTNTSLSPGSTTLPLAVGTQFNSLGSTVWKGAIDDVCIYNRALSPTEVNDLASSTVGCSVSTPTSAFTKFIVTALKKFTVTLGTKFTTN